MKKLLVIFCCFFAFVLLVIAQGGPNGGSPVQDCKKFTSCSVNNNASFPNPQGGTLTGSRGELDFIKCSTNTNIGNAREFCINNDPLATCPKTGCNFTCETDPVTGFGLGWSFTDCNDDIIIGTLICTSCGPPPTPTPDDEPDICDEMEAFCLQGGGFWKGCVLGCASPIVLDIDGDGFNLTNGQNGVDFDLTGEGQKDRISWTAANSDDAWLVLDRNSNGTIDSFLELFGNFTEQPSSIPVQDRNGFYALAEFDKPENGGNGDGKINRLDTIYRKLRLWQDKNHNGISEQNELSRLRRLDVRAIKLDFKTSKRTDRHGNRFKFRAQVRDSRDANVGKWAWDVFLVRPKPWN